MGPESRPRVLVVGAGPGGLAVAACLQRRRIGGVVLERRESVGASWRDRYDRLHLHTPRVQSHLPGHHIPRRYGRWVSRDDVVAYLEAYARHHRIVPRFGVTVERIEPDGPRWSVRTSEGSLESDAVVLATGYNSVPKVPDWPGLPDYRGELIHASAYRSGRAYADRDVLVVGTGNTGAEIAVDLVEQGAGRVRLAVRTPPHIVPRSVAGIPTTLLGIPNQFLPPWLADPGNALLQRLTIGDLSAAGLPRPADGLVARFRSTDVVPIIDVGLAQQLRAGRVEAVAGVDRFDERTVHLTDGTRLEVDVVIAATGYRTGLEALVGHLGVLDQQGRPAVAPGRSHPRAPRLYYVGLRNPLIGLLNSIRLDAQRIARSLADDLASKGQPAA
jgi:putative flavoprotein involved in K+ transport